MTMVEHTPGTFNAKAEDFHLKEYESLRRELEIVLQDSRGLERNVVLAIGATWAWLYSKSGAPWTFLIPCMFAILGAIRAHGINDTYTTFATYLSEIEEAFRKAGGPKGWEHFLRDFKKDRGTDYSKGELLFWILLIASTISVAILMFVHPLPRAPLGPPNP
jgi:hypothetical protein